MRDLPPGSVDQTFHPSGRIHIFEASVACGAVIQSTAGTMTVNKIVQGDENKRGNSEIRRFANAMPSYVLPMSGPERFPYFLETNDGCSL